MKYHVSKNKRIKRILSIRNKNGCINFYIPIGKTIDEARNEAYLFFKKKSL